MQTIHVIMKNSIKNSTPKMVLSERWWMEKSPNWDIMSENPNKPQNSNIVSDRQLVVIYCLSLSLRMYFFECGIFFFHILNSLLLTLQSASHIHTSLYSNLPHTISRPAVRTPHANQPRFFIACLKNFMLRFHST